ncbi:MAG: class B sortase [Erysipelotrichaceae bacterium]|nr:class B sortase [Erysipelotrichaceae bacterium]
MTETERKPYVPRHAKRIEEPPVPETAEEIPAIETVQEETAEEEIPAAFPEENTDDRTISNGKKKLPVLVFILSAVFIFLFFISGNRPENPSNEGDEEIGIPSNPMDPKLRKMWLSNEAINEDYVGQIVFDSGLIDLPFVQARDVYRDDGSLYVFYTKEGQLVEDPAGFSGNDVYIWTSWKTGEYDYSDEGGSVFMDYRNSLDDQNIIIYGHHYARDYDPSGSKQFSPLDILLDEENYDENKTLKLILDNEIREYTVTNVFTISILDDYQIQCVRTDMDRDLSGNDDEGFFEEFIGYMNGISAYSTGETLKPTDRILTLVTCLEHQPEYRQIIVCRETGRELFDG